MPALAIDQANRWNQRLFGLSDAVGKIRVLVCAHLVGAMIRIADELRYGEPIINLWCGIETS